MCVMKLIFVIVVGLHIYSVDGQPQWPFINFAPPPINNNLPPIPNVAFSGFDTFANGLANLFGNSFANSLYSIFLGGRGAQGGPQGPLQPNFIPPNILGIPSLSLSQPSAANGAIAGQNTAMNGQFPAAPSGQFPIAPSGLFPVAPSGQFPAAISGQSPVASSGQSPVASSGQPTATASGLSTTISNIQTTPQPNSNPVGAIQSVISQGNAANATNNTMNDIDYAEADE